MTLTLDAELEKLQRETFGYFLHETNHANGLVIDKTAPDWPSSIAATGLALACYPVPRQLDRLMLVGIRHSGALDTHDSHL